MRTLLLATKLGIHYFEVSITHLIVGFDLYQYNATKTFNAVKIGSCSFQCCQNGNLKSCCFQYYQKATS